MSQLLRLSTAATVLFPNGRHFQPSLLPFSRPPGYPPQTSCCAYRPWIAQLSEFELPQVPSPTAMHRPAELLSSIPAIVEAAGDSSAFQTASSILLTAAFTLFLFRTFRRRAKRVKQMRIRPSSAEALENLKRARVSKPPPSPDEALLGAVIAAVFGVALYKFTTSVESTLNHQPLSANYSVRQITITIRTIINGLCYLATFVFGFNSLGLFLYSGQLAMNSVNVQVPPSGGGEGDLKLNSSDSKYGDAGDSEKTTSSSVEDQTSDKTQ